MCFTDVTVFHDGGVSAVAFVFFFALHVLRQVIKCFLLLQDDIVNEVTAEHLSIWPSSLPK